MLRFLSATFLAAVAVFLWGAVTLLLIPGQDAVVLSVADEAAVLSTLREQAPAGGVYSVPIAHAEYTATTPFAMVAYRPQGMGIRQGTVMLVSFTMSWLAAMVAAALMPGARERSYAARVLGVVGLAVFATVVVHVSNWLWMGYSTTFTARAAFDLSIGWLWAGLILARLAPDDRWV